MLSALNPGARGVARPTLAADRYLVRFPTSAWRVGGVLAELRGRRCRRCSCCPSTSRSTPARGGWRGARRLDEGPGFVVLDRLPLDRMSRAGGDRPLLAPRQPARAAGGAGVEGHGHLRRAPRRPGVQRGHARRADPGRASRCTTTAAWARRRRTTSPPVPATARRGGMSIVSSALAAHNHFLRERPALLRRLYEPFYRDHQEYQAADAAATNFRPVFAWDGGLRTRFNARHIVRGYEKTGRVLDDAGAEAVALMDEFLQRSRPPPRPLARARPDPDPEQPRDRARPAPVPGRRAARAPAAPRAPLAPGGDRRQFRG